MNEQKNTMRALKDERLLSTSIWCRVGWHNWTKYGKPEVMKDGVSYFIHYQSRYCEHCGVMDIKHLKRVMAS